MLLAAARRRLDVRARARLAIYVRTCSSRSKGVDEMTLRIQRAQAARRQKLLDLYDVEMPSGSVIAGAHVDAKLSQLERQGAFKGLDGAGKPLPDRSTSHFGDDDAVDRMTMRIMAEQGVKPESLDVSSRYRPKLKAFRERLRTLADGASLDDKVRASLVHEMEELHMLYAAYTSAAVSDSLTYNLPIAGLPKLSDTLDEELTFACRCRPRVDKTRMEPTSSNE